MPEKPKRKRRYIPTGNPRGRPRIVRPPAAEQPVQPPPQFGYRIAQAARAVSVSVSKMKRMVSTGEMRSVSRGRMRIIPADALREWAGVRS
jgi:excisionase family DNA binding protein